ncbi:MAG: hypothetical protein ACPKQO_01120 [Nitrososphaeraceae archaeon]
MIDTINKYNNISSIFVVQKLEIINNEPYVNFVSSINSKYTENAYRRILAGFMKFCGIYDLDSSKLLKYSNIEIENKIRDLIINMKNNNNTKSAIAVTCAAIKHFYEMNDVYLRWKKLEKFKKGAKPSCTISNNEEDDNPNYNNIDNDNKKEPILSRKYEKYIATLEINE